jgi:hypothetical protein
MRGEDTSAGLRAECLTGVLARPPHVAASALLHLRAPNRYPDVFTTPGPFEAAFNLVKGTVRAARVFDVFCCALWAVGAAWACVCVCVPVLRAFAAWFCCCAVCVRGARAWRGIQALHIISSPNPTNTHTHTHTHTHEHVVHVASRTIQSTGRPGRAIRGALPAAALLPASHQE